MAKEPTKPDVKPEIKPAPVDKPTPKAQEEKPVYGVNELALNAKKLFNQHEDLARAALEFAKVESCTIEDAKKIIKDFAERQVN